MGLTVVALRPDRTPRSGRGAGRRRWLAAAVLGVAATMPVAAVETGPVLCPIRHLSGLPCPGCGLTRAFVHALHGDVGTSVERHPFGVLVLAVLAVWLLAGPRATGTAADPATWLSSWPRRILTVTVAACWLTWAGVRALAVA